MRVLICEMIIIMIIAYKDVIKLLRRGYPIRQTAKLADVSESTVEKVKAEQMSIFEKGLNV